MYIAVVIKRSATTDIDGTCSMPTVEKPSLIIKGTTRSADVKISGGGLVPAIPELASRLHETTIGDGNRARRSTESPIIHIPTDVSPARINIQSTVSIAVYTHPQVVCRIIMVKSAILDGQVGTIAEVVTDVYMPVQNRMRAFI